MPSDLNALGWTRLFHTQLDLELPEELTPAWWKKKKQTIAKMTRSTGMDAALTQLAADFRAMKLAHCEFNPSVHLVEKNEHDCTAFMTCSQLKAFVQQLKAVEKLADDEAKEVKKNVLTKKTAEYLLAIKAMADKVQVCLSLGSLGGDLKSAMDQWRENQKKMAKSVLFPAALASSKTTRDRLATALRAIHDGIAALKDVPAQQLNAKNTELQLASNYHTLCRDMTTPLGNLLKGYDAGVAVNHFDEPKLRKLYRDLSVIANAETGCSAWKKDDYAKWQQHAAQIDQWAQQFVALTKDITAA